MLRRAPGTLLLCALLVAASSAAGAPGRQDVTAARGSANAPRVFVKLGDLRNGTKTKSKAIERAILNESRRALEELPGVDVLPSGDSAAAVFGNGNVPVVLVSTSIQKLAAARDDHGVVYSANIEYIVHTMPDETIAARLSGNASTVASERDAKDRLRSAELRREVVQAAVRSALRGAPPALFAAARL